MPERKLYVAGFLLCDLGVRFVALVEKTRPAWQAGLLNGIGGKVEPGEAVDVAMRREFREETGVDVQTWSLFATEVGVDYVTYFYRASVEGAPDIPSRNDVGERLLLVSCEDLRRHAVVGNLRWLIPLALDWRGIRAVVHADDDIKERASW